MKKKIFSLFVALVATVAVQAQMVSAVAPNGATTLYQTLPEAIAGAQSGSVIYLPGGGFTISDEVKITKKLTIIGIGHKIKNDNADGSTIIDGNLWFNEGSSGSAVMGCYISGNVNIGDGGAMVNDVLVKFCNLNSVQVKNNLCTGVTINQNYIRGIRGNVSRFSYANVKITNNIMGGLTQVTGGYIQYNIFTSYGDAYTGSLNYIYDSFVTNNIITQIWNNPNHLRFGNNVFSDNMQASDILGENIISIGEGKQWEDVFENINDGEINNKSDYKFKEAYKQYENQVGIYAGSGFNDSQLAPTPRIVSKHIPDQTNAAGKLVINVRVKASE